MFPNGYSQWIFPMDISIQFKWYFCHLLGGKAPYSASINCKFPFSMIFQSMVPYSLVGPTICQDHSNDVPISWWMLMVTPRLFFHWGSTPIIFQVLANLEFQFLRSMKWLIVFQSYPPVIKPGWQIHHWPRITGGEFHSSPFITTMMNHDWSLLNINHHS